MSFLKYPKIYRIGAEETDGLIEFGEVVVQEKVDGANTSIWFEDGFIRGGSRSRQLGDEEFNGFVPFIHKHEGITQIFINHPNWRLYGEWLVRHTIAYKETAYHDLITEEGWAIAKQVPKIDYKKLQNLCSKKFAKIYHDILDDHISVAYQQEVK